VPGAKSEIGGVTDRVPDAWPGPGNHRTIGDSLSPGVVFRGIRHDLGFCTEPAWQTPIWSSHRAGNSLPPADFADNARGEIRVSGVSNTFSDSSRTDSWRRIADGGSADGHFSEGSRMRITFDSNDSIEQVVRTVSAVYGVTVSVDSPVAAAAPAPVAKARSAAKPASRRPAKAVQPRSTGRSRAATPVAPAEIRRWAAANGHQVNGRGRVSQAVVAAYRAANGR
jgi:hypothetical protein